MVAQPRVKNIRPRQFLMSASAVAIDIAMHGASDQICGNGRPPVCVI